MIDSHAATSERHFPDAEFGVLASSFLDGNISFDDLSRLNHILTTNEVHRRDFVRLCLFAGIMAESLAPELGEDVESNEPSVSSPTETVSEPSVSPPLIVPWIDHSIRQTVGYFSSGWPAAYLIATVIFGIGAIIGAITHISQPVQLAHKSRSVANDKEGTASITRHIGRITRMVGCKWADPKNAPATSDVCLNHTYALASGLLEITYSTGAKVILQGPVVYKVSLENGGFLSRGKLTALVEKRTEHGIRSTEQVASDGMQIAKCKLQNANYQSPNPEIPKSPNPPLTTNHYPLFTIKTPTATITDLGTEFGVEVCEDKSVAAHVFQGKVEVRTTTGEPGQPLLLSANQSVRLNTEEGRPATIIHGQADAAAFVHGEQMLQLTRSKPSKPSASSRLHWPIYDKTLVAWVALDNLDQQGVSPLSLVNMPEWDGIDFGELAPGKWMAGSHMYARTQKEQSHYPVETAAPGEVVQVAIVYGSPNISIYRNGQLYAEFPVLNQITFDENSIVLIGKRHMWDGHSKLTTLVGAVEEARLYDVALTPQQIAALRPNDPGEIGPVGWWTFEDGTARDSAGNFALGELHGNARIADGRLILDGADSYLQIPAAPKHDPKQ